MKENEELLVEIESLGWFTGDWETEVWQMAVKGLMDFTQKDVVRGFCDGHIHLCRCFTYEQRFLPAGINLQEVADLPLQVKQDLIGFLHDGPAYEPESLLQRMEKQVRRAIRIGTREMWAVADTTPDIGWRAFEAAVETRDKFRGKIEMKIACYPVFGLKNTLVEKDRLKLIEQVAKSPDCDFIVGLPEKDEEEGRIGFKGHVNTLLEIGYRNKKEVHLHADQVNSAFQKDTFKIIECLEGLTPEKLDWFTRPGRPRLWVIHVISPSCYESAEFSRLIRLLVKYNIGVIVCPTAAISMLELRSEEGPIHNSIARVIEMLKAGVRVVFGTDNVNDIFVPSGNGLILREIAEVSNYIRNYTGHILVKVGMGIQLNRGDRAILAKALYEKNKACHRHAELLQKVSSENIEFDF